MTKRRKAKETVTRILLDGENLTWRDLVKHLRQPTWTVQISNEAWRRIEKSSHAFDDYVAKGAKCYGINVGLGDLIDFPIGSGALDVFQKRLVLSHAVGVKQPLPPEVCRAIVILRLNCFAKGASGIRPATVRKLLTLYNSGAYPEIYSAGSLGASGDLAPLSQLAAFLIGEGWGYLNNKRMRASDIFSQLRLRPVSLSRKEGLSLINGTSAMVGIGMLSVSRLILAMESFLVGMALLLEAFRLPSAFVSAAAIRLKPHRGAMWVTQYLSKLLGKVNPPDRTNTTNLQPPYSLRCVPFILGPLFESLETTTQVLKIEANSANDNPIFVNQNSTVYHGGHFHGHSVSVVLDQLRIAAVHLSGVIDRQLELVLDRHRGVCPSPFLSVDPSLGYCGFEGAQYLVTSLHAENKMLAHAFSPLTLPANAGNQDYVSLGMQSAIACEGMAVNMLYVLAIYFATSAQCFAMGKRTPTSSALRPVLRLIKESLPFPYRDDCQFGDWARVLATELFFEKCIGAVRDHVPRLPRIS